MYGEKYRHVSPEAKYLFMFMLARFSLSIKNKLTDSDGNVFIYCTCKEAMEVIGCSEGKALKLFAELDCKTGIGLIERKRQGLCRPDIIYINAEAVFDKDAEKAEKKSEPETIAEETNTTPEPKLQNSENKSSGTSEIKAPEHHDLKTNNINNNYIKNNKNKINNPILPFSQYMRSNDWKEYKECIKSNINYDILIVGKNSDIIDEIVDAMVNAVCSSKEFITISGNCIPQAEVKKRFLTMDMDHIEYVYDSLSKNTTSVKNIHAYLLTTLYRAAGCITLHYQAMAKHDLDESRKNRMM
jgi:hypothetical protein